MMRNKGRWSPPHEYILFLGRVVLIGIFLSPFGKCLKGNQLGPVQVVDPFGRTLCALRGETVFCADDFSFKKHLYQGLGQP